MVVNELAELSDAETILSTKPATVSEEIAESEAVGTNVVAHTATESVEVALRVVGEPNVALRGVVTVNALVAVNVAVFTNIVAQTATVKELVDDIEAAEIICSLVGPVIVKDELAASEIAETKSVDQGWPTVSELAAVIADVPK